MFLPICRLVYSFLYISAEDLLAVEAAVFVRFQINPLSDVENKTIKKYKVDASVPHMYIFISQSISLPGFPQRTSVFSARWRSLIGCWWKTPFAQNAPQLRPTLPPPIQPAGVWPVWHFEVGWAAVSRSVEPQNNGHIDTLAEGQKSILHSPVIVWAAGDIYFPPVSGEVQENWWCLVTEFVTNVLKN